VWIRVVLCRFLWKDCLQKFQNSVSLSFSVFARIRNLKKNLFLEWLCIKILFIPKEFYEISLALDRLFRYVFSHYFLFFFFYIGIICNFWSFFYFRVVRVFVHTMENYSLFAIFLTYIQPYTYYSLINFLLRYLDEIIFRHNLYFHNHSYNVP